MAQTLTKFADEIRTALQEDQGRAGKERVSKLVSKYLLDKDFIATHLKTRASGGNPREVLYEDPKLGFCICGHVYDNAANGAPHDHGSSWAIYGLAQGTTEMTDWRIVKPAEGAEPALVEPVRTYDLAPGDAHLYDVGAVHSPMFNGTTRLLRVEGANLDRVKHSNIAAA